MVWVVPLSSDKVIPARLTPPPLSPRWAFAVCMSLVTSSWPRTHTALYLPAPPRRAAPPCISGRTSYLRVRLAFHPYPQLLPWFCNTSGCEPRRIVTSASLWPWVAHTVSGPIAATCLQVIALAAAPSSDSVSLRLPSSLGRLTCGNDDALAGSFYKRHAISPLVAPASGRSPSPRSPCHGKGLGLLLAFAVSGPLASPSRGAFHLSLTVLCPLSVAEGL